MRNNGAPELVGGEVRYGTRGLAVWLTGLSGAGKTTISKGVKQVLDGRGVRCHVLDGDEFREILGADLGFSSEDRIENIRRITCVAEMLVQNGIIVVVATISPLECMRRAARAAIPEFLEVFVDAPLAVCEQRDPKNLYKRAREGTVAQFTGVSDTYEVPASPDVVCATSKETIEESIHKVCTRILGEMVAPLPIQAVRGDSGEKRRKTLAVDVDGVLAEYDGWQGCETVGSPRADVVQVLHVLRAEGWKIVIHTTRGSDDIIDYLNNARIPYDDVNCNTDYSNRGSKPVATVYWDDRALRYSGNAYVDLQAIRSFTTWSGR